MNFAYKLREALEVDFFSQNDLKALFSPMSDASLHNGVSRALKSGELIQLKRGFYVFSKKLRKTSLSKFLVANKLYGPSYVSFESALSYYGLIPEAVYTTTSACHQRKQKEFENELGLFSYHFIPCSDFFLGVSQESSKENALVATPLRALFDYVYVHKKKYKTLEQIQQDLRLEAGPLETELERHHKEELENLARQYKKKNVLEVCDILIKAFK